MITLNINGKTHKIDLPADTPLLWTLRDELGLTGTKYGCGISACGACTIHVDHLSVRACVTPISAAIGKQIVTIEAVNQDQIGQKVQDAWLDLDVAQCGYCQAGQIMSATALLKQNSQPNDAEIDRAMSGHICRCGTYNRIRSAIKLAAGMEEQA